MVGGESKTPIVWSRFSMVHLSRHTLAAARLVLHQANEQDSPSTFQLAKQGVFPHHLLLARLNSEIL